MKKLALILAAALSITALFGCGEIKKNESAEDADGKAASGSSVDNDIVGTWVTTREDGYWNYWDEYVVEKDTLVVQLFPNGTLLAAMIDEGDRYVNYTTLPWVADSENGVIYIYSQFADYTVKNDTAKVYFEGDSYTFDRYDGEIFEYLKKKGVQGDYLSSGDFDSNDHYKETEAETTGNWYYGDYYDDYYYDTTADYYYWDETAAPDWDYDYYYDTTASDYYYDYWDEAPAEGDWYYEEVAE